MNFWKKNKSNTKVLLRQTKSIHERALGWQKSIVGKELPRFLACTLAGLYLTGYVESYIWRSIWLRMLVFGCFFAVCRLSLYVAGRFCQYVPRIRYVLLSMAVAILLLTGCWGIFFPLKKHEVYISLTAETAGEICLCDIVVDGKNIPVSQAEVTENSGWLYRKQYDNFMIWPEEDGVENRLTMRFYAGEIHLGFPYTPYAGSVAINSSAGGGTWDLRCPEWAEGEAVEYADILFECHYSLTELLLYIPGILLILGFFFSAFFYAVNQAWRKSQVRAELLLFLKNNHLDDGSMKKGHLKKVVPNGMRRIRRYFRSIFAFLFYAADLITEILPESRPAYVLFVFVLAGTIIIGGKINTAETPYFHKLFILDYGWIVLLCGIAFILGKFLIACMNRYLREAQRAEKQKRWWLGAFFGILLMWMPYLLAYYPGVVTEDSLVSLMQAENLSLLYNHIPVAYTLLIALFTRIGWALGDRNFGVFLFTLVQMILMAGALSYSIYWIRTRISKNKAVTYILLFFYGLNPVIALYSVTMWKDVLFSAWILLFCLFLFDVGISKGAVLEGKKGLIRLGVLFTLAAFGRNNGIYVVILIWTALLIIYKDIRMRLFAVGGGVILSILLIQGPGYQAMEIDQSGFAESVGIPLQQICYTVVQDGTLTEKDEEFLEKVIPIQTIKECYSPVSADNIKFNPEFDTAFFEAHKAEFIKLYLRMLPPNLPYYVESYLLSTVGFWHIEPIGWLGSDGVSKNEMGIYGIDYLKEWFHLDGKGKLTSAVTSMQRWPVTNVGLLVWLVFFYVMLSFMQKQPWKALAALPLVGCWLTIMIATPVCAQFRYVYYYHLMLPVICILLFIKRKEETREACELPGIPEECDSKEVPGE